MRGGRTRRGAAKRPASQTKPGSDPDEVGDNDQRQKGGDAANDIPSGREVEETQQPAPSNPAPVVSKAKGNKRRGTAAAAAPAPAAAKKNQKAKASSTKSDPTPAAAAKKTADQRDPAVVEGRCDEGQSEAEAALEDGAEGSASVDDKGEEEKGDQGVASPPSSAEEQKAAAGRRGRKGKAQLASAVAEKPTRRGSSRAKAAVKYVADDNDVRAPGDGRVCVCALSVVTACFRTGAPGSGAVALDVFRASFVKACCGSKTFLRIPRAVCGLFLASFFFFCFFFQGLVSCVTFSCLYYFWYIFL